MIAKNVLDTQMQQALIKVNEKYEGNIRWNRFDIERTSIHFTLKVIDSSKAGHSEGKSSYNNNTRRRLISACWHVHGDFFDCLFEICPNAVIISRGEKITKDEGNWIDINIGSNAEPLYSSDNCECNGCVPIPITKGE